MRRLPAVVRFGTPAQVHRVVSLDGLAAEWSEDRRFLVRIIDEQQRQAVESVRRGGLSNVSWVECDGLEEADVVVTSASRPELRVLHREADLHHSLFMTNRCNSYCLMCSQPPTSIADDWLVEEALEVVRHIRISPAVMGMTGGEPLLLGSGVRRVMDALRTHHPETKVEVLTNGRLFAQPSTLKDIVRANESHVSWLVPLYGHADFLHDFVVQTPGAFEQTIGGLLALREFEQPIQLRVVLIAPVLQSLVEFCTFIGRNLPFVREVALMACEPIGFALANREQCEVDLLDWSETLERSAAVLARYGVPHLFMNTPLCALPPALWPDAHRSISDWKQVYADDCSSCTVRDRCCGLFAWHERGWKPTRVQPVLEATT